MKTKRGGFMIGIGAAVGIMLAAAGPAAAWTDATGGSYTNVYTTNGITYRAHVFTNTGSSTFTVTTGGSVEALLVGGGGGGGSYSGGGGGGGWVTRSAVTLTNGSYTVTVGAGGAGAPNYNTVSAGSGNPSRAFSLAAPGGSGGGSYYVGAVSGYVGGGGSGNSTTPGTGIPPGGNGGAGYKSGGSGTGGGGGGANGNGPAANASKGGNGGVGVTNDFLNGTPTGYGGGGGGGWIGIGSIGFGVDGGGDGGGVKGTANTGGGGGGQNNNTPGGVGGSGIVIVRYATVATVPLVYTLAATDLTTNSATLNGTLAYLPSGKMDIRVYWGTTDMGKTAAGWMYTNDVASNVDTAPSSYTYSATSLSTNYTYYYRYYGTNTAGSGECWGDVQSFSLLASFDLGLAVYGYPAGSLFQWENSVDGTSWLEVTNGRDWNLRVTKAMYTAKPYYRVGIIRPPRTTPNYSSTAKVRDAPPSGLVFTIR